MNVSTMARQRISPFDRFCRTKLNRTILTATLVYVGYLLGCTNNDAQNSQQIRGGKRDDANPNGKDDHAESLRSVGSADAPATMDKNSDQIASMNAVKSPAMEDMATEYIPNKSAYANGPVIYNDDRRATTINLLGERHSGTNWIADHLKECVSILRWRNHTTLSTLFWCMN